MKDSIIFCPIKEISGKLRPGKLVIMTDEKIHSLFGKDFPSAPTVLVPRGEAAKSWEILRTVYGRLASLNVDRSWSLLAVGGGSVSDVGGFAAHTWMRGLSFFSAPTTLLAMTDAALGGKNGIDLDGYKNVVGSFQLPEAVFCDIASLYSLDATQFSSGMAEVIKHAILDGEAYFSYLEKILESSKPEGRFAHENCEKVDLERLVRESQRIKLGIAGRDFRESGERRLLNLGHTFGHAIESVTGLPHGHCVSLGIMAACSFSARRGTMDAAATARIGSLLAGFGLPVRLADVLDRKAFALCREALLMDKKREGDFMNLVIPQGIGAVTVQKVAVSELKSFFDEGGL